MFETQATVKVKNSQNVVIAEQKYTKVVFEGLSLDGKGNPVGGTPEELLTAAIAFYQSKNPKSNGVLVMLADATYANDLGQRNSIRQSLIAGMAGPDKAIEKAIKDLMAARAASGKPIVEARAREKVLAALAED